MTRSWLIEPQYEIGFGVPCHIVCMEVGLSDCFFFVFCSPPPFLSLSLSLAPSHFSSSPCICLMLALIKKELHVLSYMITVFCFQQPVEYQHSQRGHHNNCSGGRKNTTCISPAKRHSTSSSTDSRFGPTSRSFTHRVSSLPVDQICTTTHKRFLQSSLPNGWWMFALP